MTTVNNIFTIPAHIKCTKSTFKTIELNIFKVNKAPEQRQWYHSVVFLVKFEYILKLALVFSLLTLSM